jgi:uncharacterized metal-binding protein
VASGRAHESINLGAYIGLAAAYQYARSQGALAGAEALVNRQTLTLFSLSYLIGTFLVTPDLDLAEQRVRSKSNWGLLGLLWVPYGALFSHRGLSHSWFLGPLTRLLYMVVVALAISWLAAVLAPLFGYSLSVRTYLVTGWQQLALAALVGYYLSQWLHLVADGIWPDHGARRATRRARRR